MCSAVQTSVMLWQPLLFMKQCHRDKHFCNLPDLKLRIGMANSNPNTQRKALRGTVVRPRWPSGRITTCRAALCSYRAVGKEFAGGCPNFSTFSLRPVLIVMLTVGWGDPKTNKSQHAAQRRQTKSATLCSCRAVGKQSASGLPT